MYKLWKQQKNLGVEMGVNGNNPWKGKPFQTNGCFAFNNSLING